MARKETISSKIILLTSL